MEDTRLPDLLEQLAAADPVDATALAEELAELLASFLEESRDL